MNHSKLPFIAQYDVDAKDYDLYGILSSSSKEYIAADISEQDADFIVKACNNHYELLNAAQYAFDTFRAFRECNMTSLGMDQAINDLGKVIKQVGQ